MGGRRARLSNAARGVLLALALASCLPTIADRVAEVRAKLIGLKARDLNGCVGVPFNIDEDGETEYLTYRWVDQEESDPFEAKRFPSLPPDPAEVLRRQRGDTEPEDPRDRNAKEDESRPPRGVAYCELVFEVREGRVKGVEVEGRRANGLNDDAQCISKAERCLPRS